MTYNGFTRIDSNQLTTKKKSRIFIQTDSWLKKLSGIFIRWSHDSTIQIYCWFRWPFLGFQPILLTFFPDVTKFHWPFWSFTKFRWHFFGHSSIALIRISSSLKQYLEDLSRFNSWLNWLSRNWLGINSCIKWIRQVLIQIDSGLKVLPHFFIQINSWLKRKVFDSESTHASTLSHAHVW